MSDKNEIVVTLPAKFFASGWPICHFKIENMLEKGWNASIYTQWKIAKGNGPTPQAAVDDASRIWDDLNGK